METNQIQMLTDTFEGHAQKTENGVEYWLGRDLQFLLGYSKWDNFLNVIAKARTACDVSGHAVADHFADVGKRVDAWACMITRARNRSCSNGARTHEHARHFQGQGPGPSVVPLTALQRASMLARKAAIQTETDPVVVMDGRLVLIETKTLREQAPHQTDAENAPTR